MSALKNFLLLFLISCTSLITHADELLEKAREACLSKNDVVACRVVIDKNRFLKNYKICLEISEKMCSIDTKSCSEMYRIAGEIDEKTQNKIFEKMSESCNKDAAYCQALADIYEDRRDIQNALKFGRKYYEKYKKGSYPWLSYKHGTDKKVAFEDALEKCRADNFSCGFTIRYMPDHPQYQELLTYAEKDCKKKNQDSTGATTCAILGSYYLKKGDPTKAYELWWHDCPTNQLSCLLIIGSKKYSRDDNISAFKKFCNPNQNAFEGTLVGLRTDFCNDFKSVPDAVVESGQKTLAGFLEQQH